MHRLFTIAAILLSFTAYGQSVSKEDSLKILETIQLVFHAFEKPDFQEFQKISADTIYCILCAGTNESEPGPPVIGRKDFFDNHLKTITIDESYKRAFKSNGVSLAEESDHKSDITASVIIWNRNDLYEGHGGVALELYFKRNEGEFKFSGIETIP